MKIAIRSTGPVSVFPGMVTEGFPQRVAADMLREIGIISCFFYNTVSLLAADVRRFVFLACKKTGVLAYGVLILPQHFQGSDSGAVQGNHGFFFCFLFCQM